MLDYDEIRGADGIHEACELLFGDDAQRRYDEYFTEERGAQLQEYRQGQRRVSVGFGSGYSAMCGPVHFRRTTGDPPPWDRRRLAS